MLDILILNKLSTDILLLSFPYSFFNFLVNFNINKIEACLKELFNMLTTYENTIIKEKFAFVVGSLSRTKKGPEGKGSVLHLPRKKNPIWSPLRRLLKGSQSPRIQNNFSFTVRIIDIESQLHGIFSPEKFWQGYVLYWRKCIN